MKRNLVTHLYQLGVRRTCLPVTTLYMYKVLYFTPRREIETYGYQKGALVPFVTLGNTLI